MAEQWIEVQQFKIYEPVVNSIGRGYVLCTLSEELRSHCDCIWYRFEKPDEDIVKVQHGDNPEHSIVITAEEFIRDNWCTKGHVVSLCVWATRIINYVHPHPRVSIDGGPWIPVNDIKVTYDN